MDGGCLGEQGGLELIAREGEQVSRTLTVAQWNIGFLIGDLGRRQQRNYLCDTAAHALRYFIPGAMSRVFSSRKENMGIGLKHMAESLRCNQGSPKARLARIIRYVRKNNVDVLALNEADLIFPGINQVRAIQEHTDLKHAVHASCFGARLGPWGVAENGNAILSRYPLMDLDESGGKVDVWYIDQPDPYVYATDRLERLAGIRVGNWGRRLMRVRVDVDGLAYDVATTHLHHKAPFRTYQAQEIRRLAEEVIRRPFLLAADLNSTYELPRVIRHGDSEDGTVREALECLEALVDFSALPPEYTMFERNGHPPMPGTYAVKGAVIDRRLVVDPRFPPDRAYDHVFHLRPSTYDCAGDPHQVKARSLSHRVDPVIASDHLPVRQVIELSGRAHRNVYRGAA